MPLEQAEPTPGQDLGCGGNFHRPGGETDFDISQPCRRLKKQREHMTILPARLPQAKPPGGISIPEQTHTAPRPAGVNTLPLRVASPRSQGFWRKTLTSHSDSSPFTGRGSIELPSWHGSSKESRHHTQPAEGLVTTVLSLPGPHLISAWGHQLGGVSIPRTPHFGNIVYTF